MKIAIIGANGFIGARLVEYLHLGGEHQIVPIVRRPAALALAARFDLPWRVANPHDPASLAPALAGCDAVVHSALGDLRQIETMPLALVQAAAQAGVPRIVYLSTASVHGQAPVPGTDEMSPLHCRHALRYNNSKVRAEAAFFKACRQHGRSGFALRPGVVLGPRSRWITDLANDLRQGRAWLLGEGDGICNSIHVDNLAHAVARSLIAPAAAAAPYLVGDAELVTWRQLYGSVAAALGVDPAAIPSIAPSALPDFRPGRGERLRAVVASPAIQAVLPSIPAVVKRTAKHFLGGPARPVGGNVWALPPAHPSPRITQEIALLQSCRWKFPQARAAAALGYAPPVTFAEGLDRTLAWLAFVE